MTAGLRAYCQQRNRLRVQCCQVLVLMLSCKTVADASLVFAQQALQAETAA